MKKGYQSKNKISSRFKVVMCLFIQKYWTIVMKYSVGKVTWWYQSYVRLILSDKTSTLPYFNYFR